MFEMDTSKAGRAVSFLPCCVMGNEVVIPNKNIHAVFEMGVPSRKESRHCSFVLGAVRETIWYDRRQIDNEQK